MGNTLSCFQKKLKNSKEEDSEEEVVSQYFFLTKKKIREYYIDVYRNPYNNKIALEKKSFDKITTVRMNLTPGKVPEEADWKKYILKYCEKQEKNGIGWYSDIIIRIKDNPFLFENKFQSHVFFKDFQFNFIPDCLFSLAESEDRNNTEFFSEQHALSNICTDVIANQDDLIEKLNSSTVGLGNTANSLSRIDLSGVTDNLGGSFNSSRCSLNSNDPSFKYKSFRKRIKSLVKIFKDHLSNDDHPIKILILIFEDQMSYVISEKIKEFKGDEAKEDSEYYQNLSELNEEVASHIKKFILKAQTAFKLFYSKSINLECFFEEKDELINLLTSVLFGSGTIYEKLFTLYSMEMEPKIEKFKKQLQYFENFSPKDLSIPEKFCLDESTRALQEKIKKEYLLKKKDDMEESQESIDNKEELVLTNPRESRLTITSGRQVELGKRFHSKNTINGYSTIKKIIHGLKYNKIPFEKLLLVASISSEITECVNTFWKGMEKMIPSTLLNINADELMAIFIYLISQSQFPEILVHQKIINDFTTRTTKSSMIGYYNTTLEAAIEYIGKEKVNNSSSKESLEEVETHLKGKVSVNEAVGSKDIELEENMK